MSSENDKGAISIASVTQDGRFCLNMNNVNTLVNKLADKEDVAIISMAGAFRTGKSFMLSIFLRYLREKGWENVDWFGAEDKKLHDGFDWERGRKPHTQGINVWPEIFNVPLESGNKISVMIVDTQGLHDLSSTRDTNHKIMMLSTLLSSHQIVNCSKNIEQRDLEFLHSSVEYAKAIARKFQTKDEHPFQAITFLVRDWDCDFEFSFGDNGGCELVENILKDIPANMPRTVKEVKESIGIAFENVYGFLMPLPEKEIRGKLEYSAITNADIEGEFRKYACQLTEKILHPKNLIAKQMCGQPMSTNTFLGLIAEISKVFESGDLPPVDKMIKCYEKADNIADLINAVSIYQQQMNKNISKFDTIIPEDDVFKYHKNAMQEVHQLFSQKTSNSSEVERSEVWKRIEEECENYSNSVLDENKDKKRQREQKIYEISAELEKQYEQKIRDLNISAMPEADLEAQLTEYREEAEQKYNKETEDCTDVLSDIIDEMRQRLMNKLSDFSKLLKSEKEIEEKNKKLVQKEEELNIQNAIREAEISFDKEKAEIVKGYHSDISKKLENKKLNRMLVFDQKCAAFKNRTEVEKYREKLMETLKESIKLAENENSKTKEQLTKEYRDNIKIASKEYEREMEKYLAKGPVDKDELSQHHGSCKTLAQKIFDDKVKTMKTHLEYPALDNFRSKLKKSIQDKYIKGFKKTNQMNLTLLQQQEKDSEECVKHIKSALENYTKEMNELLASGAYFEDEELKAKHDIREKKLKEEIIALTADLSEQQRNIDLIEEQLQAKFLQFQSKNKDNRAEALENEKLELIRTSVQQYTNSMRELTMNNIIEEKILEEKHIEFKNKALETLSNNSVFLNDDWEDVKQTLDNIHLRFRAENNNAKEKEKFDDDKQKLYLEKLKTRRDDCRNEFIGEIRKHGKKYTENFENICSDTKEKIMKKFDEAVQCLKGNISEEDFEKTMKELELEINKEIEIAMLDNTENQTHEKNNVETIVNTFTTSYRSMLNKHMKKHYVKPTRLNKTEKEFLDDIEKGTMGQNIKDKIILAIKAETEKARNLNAKNERFRIFTLDDDSIIEQLRKLVSNLLTYLFGKDTPKDDMEAQIIE
ncbi:uncharacterized protein LOC120325420 [Styela clava]